MKVVKILSILLVILLTACSETLSSLDDAVTDFEVGEPVVFTTNVPGSFAETRALVPDATLLSGYKTIMHDYSLRVTMYEYGNDTPLGTCTYRPQPADVPTESNNGFNEDGLLAPAPEETETRLFWPSNEKQYGFEVTAGTETLEADQSTQEKWLQQDRLHGYAFMPLLDDSQAEGAQAVDNIDALNYRTNKEWGAMNRTWMASTGELLQPDDYKRIPLFLKHQRAWITVILRAGEGVQRDALKYATSEENIRMTINSYAAGSNSAAFPIDQAWSSETLIDYQKDKNGEAQQNVSTTRYDAIVEPHNYATNKDEEVIAKINLSQQNFSFYANSDRRYKSGTEAEKEQADADYNLEAGKHLTLDVTLSRDSRKILITAWVEDWTEVATSTICDDYGQNGDPVVIKDRAELIAFLTDPKTNCQGSVGIIQPTELNLDLENDPWSAHQYDLNATLNLAGCTLKTGSRLFNSMSSSANLVNGMVQITDGATVESAIATKNEGTIERVHVITSGENSTARATVAGMVGLNNGTIYQCSSALPVDGSVATSIEGYSQYVGGIAAVSISKDASSMAVIDGCTVNAAVNGAATMIGGGIVGYATGRVSNNTFEYGITINQTGGNFKNIFGVAGTTDLRAYGNGWPTTALNPISDATPASNPNRITTNLYDATIDCQEELAKLMSSTYNITGKNYLISKSFAVTSSSEPGADWTYGTVFADNLEHSYNVRFNLDGNSKTITLTGTKTVQTTDGTKRDEGDATTYTTAPMLFNYVFGEIKNLTLYLEQSIVAEPSVSAETGTYSAEDAIAPLAYAVYGGKLSNIKVKAHKNAEGVNDVFVQAATPAGLVVWAYGKATIENCQVQVPVRMWLPTNLGSQAKHYAGGIVACAAEASIRQCTYLVQTADAVSAASTSDKASQSADYYYGGIVGGTSVKGTENPSLQIADCTSWFIAERATEENPDKSSKGSIIGYTCYGDESLANGMSQTQKSEGNWWPMSAVGAHVWASGLSEELVIGKRNSVAPTYDTNF